jgi:two-component system chemotaxis response regulator CheB
MAPPIRRGPGHDVLVLIIDDSALVRHVVGTVLAREEGITVSTAATPLIAIKKIARARPDVILLDIEMPQMDGLTFLRALMARDPIPVVICSSHAGSETELALRALREGAVEIIVKPHLGIHDFLHDSAVLLVDAVRSAARARVSLALPRATERPELQAAAAAVVPAPEHVPDPHRPEPSTRPCEWLVAIGASTGGTQALQTVLSAMPADSPGVVVVQHMPEHFTRSFAHRLDGVCRMDVKEAASGDPVIPGRVLIAPGNKHMMVRRHGGGYRVALADAPLVSRHRPSVDVLFQSVAHAAGAHAIGVIMTGMGNDGAAGLLAMKEAGAITIAQDEASCVVFGMPREALSLGAVTRVVRLQHLAAVLRSAVAREPR